MIRPTPNLARGGAAGLSWSPLPHHVPHWRLGSVAISRVVGHTPSRHFRSTSSRAMQQHSLELALEEADGRVHEEQLLRRANVSPFFSSCKNPLGSDFSTRQADEPRPIPPLSLDLCGPDETSGGSLSRVSSWHDFTLDADSAETASSESPAEPGAWALFLDGKTPNGLPVVYPLKTPTAEGGFFEGGSVSAADDLKVLSPTHIDKKVLVTDNDLKLSSTASRASFCPRRVASEPLAARTPPSVRSRVRREKLFPQEATPTRTFDSHSVPSGQFDNRYHRLALPRTLGLHDTRVAPDQLPQSEPSVLRRLPELSTLPYTPIVESHPSVNIPFTNLHSKRTHFTTDQILFSFSPARAIGRAHEPKRQRIHVPSELVQREYARVVQQSLCQPLAPLVAPPKRRPSRRRIGIYTPEARRERIRRFHEKRKLRVFHKRVKYDCRKRLANACPRIKGRFVRKDEFAEATKQQSAEPESGE